MVDGVVRRQAQYDTVPELTADQEAGSDTIQGPHVSLGELAWYVFLMAASFTAGGITTLLWLKP